MSVISDFFDERLKKKSKEEVVESIFSALEQCHFATHIGKLTNPDVKTNLYVQHGPGDDDVVATDTTQCMNDGYYPNASMWKTGALCSNIWQRTQNSSEMN